MTDAAKGVLAIVAACVVWGLSAMFYKLLVHVPPLEVLAHRTIWSCVIFLGVLLVQGRVALLGRALSGPKEFLMIGFAALMISVNWFFFISSIQIGRAVEASLGYYIFPLVSVLFGALFFRERLGLVQRFAVGLATLAVVVLTAGLGVAPWIALILATSFAIYGVVKKSLSVGPVVSVTAEVLLLTPIAALVLWQAHATGGGAFGTSLGDSVLLMLSGLLTATPLILFSYATKRLTLVSVGLLQYLNPTLQFLVATLVFRELFTLWHAIAFGLIWTALALYSAAAWRQDRSARKRSVKS